MIHGDYGIEGVALSLPTVVGQNGMDVRVPIHLNEEEIEQLRSSAKVLKETLDTEFPE
jgi:L-lactate dehydrogenase